MVTHLESDNIQCEVKWALGSISMNKASGGDGIPCTKYSGNPVKINPDLEGRKLTAKGFVFLPPRGGGGNVGTDSFVLVQTEF